MKVYPKRVGGFDATKLPGVKPTGVVSSTEFSSSALENASDVSQIFGAQKPNPPRGSRTPNRSAQIPTQERTHKR